MRPLTLLPLLTSLALSACSIAPTSKSTGEQEKRKPVSPSLMTAEQRLEAEENRLAIPEPGPTQADDSSGAGPDDVWARLRAGLALPQADRPAVRRERQRFSRRPEHLERVGRRARPYLRYIVKQLDARGLPMELALVPVVESGYRPFAYSNGHAAGLWQFVPATAEHFGLRRDWWYDGRRDFIAATDAALDYFEYLHEFFDGDWLLALAAYNAGEGRVRRAVRRNRERGEPTDFWHLDLPKQTEAYVPRILAIRDIVAAPRAYQVSLPSIPDEPVVRVVKPDGQIDLALAADLAGISTDRLYQLNPGYNRWATPPDGPHRVVVPAASAERLKEGLAATADTQRMRWQRHKVVRGDTLGEIAEQYHSSVAVLRDVNNINGHVIRVGQELVIPLSERPTGRPGLADRSTGNPTRRHEVQHGDSLWEIARRYDVTVRELAARNGLRTNTTLQPGQTLRVPGSGAAAGGRDRQRVVYTVRQGDSLYRIAREFGVQVADLRRWNRIGRGEYLQPGQRLQLQVDPSR